MMFEGDDADTCLMCSSNHEVAASAACGHRGVHSRQVMIHGTACQQKYADSHPPAEYCAPPALTHQQTAGPVAAAQKSDTVIPGGQASTVVEHRQMVEVGREDVSAEDVCLI